jgi:hypothetical protein
MQLSHKLKKRIGWIFLLPVPSLPGKNSFIRFFRPRIFLIDRSNPVLTEIYTCCRRSCRNSAHL